MIPELPGMIKIHEEEKEDIQKATYLFKNVDISKIFKEILKNKFNDWNLEKEEVINSNYILKFSTEKEIIDIKLQFKRGEGTFINICSLTKREK